jgi:hypothetical protein
MPSFTRLQVFLGTNPLTVSPETRRRTDTWRLPTCRSRSPLSQTNNEIVIRTRTGEQHGIQDGYDLDGALRPDFAFGYVEAGSDFAFGSVEAGRCEHC